MDTAQARKLQTRLMARAHIIKAGSAGLWQLQSGYRAVLASSRSKSIIRSS